MKIIIKNYNETCFTKQNLHNYENFQILYLAKKWSKLFEICIISNNAYNFQLILNLNGF